MSSTPGNYDIVVSRGDTLQRDFLLTYTESGLPVALTATQKVRGQIRSEEGREGTTTATTLLLDLTEGNGRLEIVTRDPSHIRLIVSAADNIAICPDNEQITRYWSLELFDDSVSPEHVKSLLAGVYVLTPEITR